MATDSPTARFRPATDFPKTIQSLEQEQANQLYSEMRDCLIFTNRSRAQLIRRNEEYKQSLAVLRSDTARLQGLIQQLTAEKSELLRDRQAVISELEQELRTMTTHLEGISSAFDEVQDINGAMGAMAIPGKFARFWQALKALIIWWRDNYEQELPPPPPSSLPEDDRIKNPQMYTDIASIQRSELS
jgi:hypothetical protein